MRIARIFIIILAFDSCIQSSVNSHLYLKERDSLLQLASSVFDTANKLDSNKHRVKYSNLMLQSSIYYTKADSFLLLNLDTVYRLTRVKYWNTDSLTFKMMSITNKAMQATEDKKYYQGQADYYKKKINISN